MTTYKKYMFDLDFGPPAPPRAAPAADIRERLPEPEAEEPPAPTFTEDDLQVVRDAAYEEGFSNGVTETKAGAEMLMASAMNNMAEALAGLGAAQEQSADQAQRVATRVAMAVVRKMLPAACERHAFDEVIRAVESCFSQVLDEPRIIVRVSAELVDAVRDLLEAKASAHGFEGRVVVQADTRLALGDCRVEWADGGAERDQARLMADIEAAVERSLAAPQMDDHGQGE